jgi:flagellar basal body rod protein FlgC
MKRSEMQRQLIDLAVKYDAKYDALAVSETRSVPNLEVMDEMAEMAQILRSTMAYLGVLELDKSL